MSEATLRLELPLSSDEQRMLRAVVGSMIPANSEYDVPGADDERIFAEVLVVANAEASRVRQGLAQLDELAGGAFAEQDLTARTAAAERLHECAPAVFMLLVGIAVRCYYRDDRVMESLGMERRPPFPLGFELEQGDWSLLDAVRERGPIYRKVP